jgi:hypothetical protein
MLLIISLVLAILPLVGIAWYAKSGAILTVDGLFASLILLTISGIFGINALSELRREQRRRAFVKANPHLASTAMVAAVEGGVVVQGIVRSVEFFESRVGQPNKSVVTISNGSGSGRILVLEGDLRNRLPAGKKVQFTYREENGSRKLFTTDFV